MATWITDRQPEAPEADPCDYRTESAVVLIQTVRGEHMAARWVVYQDSDFDSVWELVGRDGLQLDPADVVAWQPIAPFAQAAA